jgi:hypothetical protein
MHLKVLVLPVIMAVIVTYLLITALTTSVGTENVHLVKTLALNLLVMTVQRQEEPSLYMVFASVLKALYDQETNV